MRDPIIAFMIFLFVVAGRCDARLFANKGKEPRRPANKKPSRGSGPVDKGDQRPHQASTSSKTKSKDNNTSADTVVKEKHKDEPEVRRITNHVRVTLTDVDNVDSFTPAETIFFEDCFMSAFIEVEDPSNEDDVQVRSIIVLDETPSQHRDRSLSLRTSGLYFDISALFEWSCRLCGLSTTRSSTTTSTTSSNNMDDDYTNDDFYFGGVTRTSSPTASPTGSPTPMPTYHSGFDDDFRDDDFYFNGPVADTVMVADDDLTDDTFYFSGTADQAGDDTMADDDVFSFFFGQRRLEAVEESDERRLEDLLCRKLRAGPFPVFHGVKECFVLFTA